MKKRDFENDLERAAVFSSDEYEAIGR